MTSAAWVCLFLPLGSAGLITVLGTATSRRAAAWIATVSCFAAFAAAIVSFVSMLGREPEHRAELSTAWTWLAAGDFRVTLDILIDPLSVMMMLIVSGVGALIAFSRHFGRDDGQIFALAVMAVAASEVVVGLGLIVAIARKRLDLDVDRLRVLRG